MKQKSLLRLHFLVFPSKIWPCIKSESFIKYQIRFVDKNSNSDEQTKKCIFIVVTQPTWWRQKFHSILPITFKNANLIYGGTGVNYSLVANKNTTNLIGSFVYLNINFTQAITYVSPSFVTGRIRVFNGTIWQDVITYQYKNSKFNEFTK